MIRTEAPKVRPFGDLIMPPQVTEVLPNGIRLHLISGGNQPISKITVLFSGGNCELDNNQIGRLTVGSLSDGATGYSPEELSDLIDFNGLRIGASGHIHNTSFGISVLNHRFEEVLPLIGDILQSPTFPADRFEAASLRTRANIRTSRQEVSLTAAEAFAELMCGTGHPLAHKNTESDIDGFGPDEAVELYRRLLCPARMHVFLSGQLDSRIIDAVKRTFGSLSGTDDGIERRIIPYSPAGAPCHLKVRHEHTFQSAVVAGMPAIQRSHPDYIPLRLAVMALGGYFGSRLVANIREEKGLTYGITASLNGSPEGSYVEISAMCDKKYAGQVLDEVASELKLLATDPPRGAELERLKLSATTSLAEMLDTPFSRMGYYMTQVLVGTSDNYFEEQCRQIRLLTSDRIAEMAFRYLDPQFLYSVISGLNDE